MAINNNARMRANSATATTLGTMNAAIAAAAHRHHNGDCTREAAASQYVEVPSHLDGHGDGSFMDDTMMAMMGSSSSSLRPAGDDVAGLGFAGAGERPADSWGRDGWEDFVGHSVVGWTGSAGDEFNPCYLDDTTEQSWWWCWCWWYACCATLGMWIV